MTTLLLVHGPNLNLLGERKPEVYGTTTLIDIENDVAAAANGRGVTVICFHSNSEGAILDFLHGYRKVASGIVINAGALTHTSVALHDAIEGVNLPTVEVHISNTHAREGFRHTSMIAPVCIGQVTGLGRDGYTVAVNLLLDHLGTSVPPAPQSVRPEPVEGPSRLSQPAQQPPQQLRDGTPP